MGELEAAARLGDAAVKMAALHPPVTVPRGALKIDGLGTSDTTHDPTMLSGPLLL